MTQEVEAAQGQKMIEVTIRFWTDDLAEQPGHVVPKKCWSSGVVRVSPNQSHGITGKNPVPFNSLSQIVPTIEELFIAHGIKVVPSSHERRYRPQE
jgi:hypothetical protein